MRSIKKRSVSFLLAFVMVLSLCPTVFAAAEGLDNFKKVKTYTEGQFTDVPAGKWYSANVKAAYELGLMEGKGNGTFSPTANISVVETIVTACRLHSIYHTGKSGFVNGSPWYQPYVDYAIENGIIRVGEFSNYTAPATRAQFVTILSRTFPESALPAINNIAMGGLPDVPFSASYADSVYLMYNAGILTGNDDYGTFDPDSTISRVQAAAIMTRMADATLRQQKTLKRYDPHPPTAVTIQDSMVSWSVQSTDLHIGQSTQLDVILQPGNACSGITWTSSDPSVVSVGKDGAVRAHKKGTATITATTYNGKKDTFTINVPYEEAKLQYALTADQKGYEIVGCDADAYTAHIPAAYQGLPVVSVKGGAFKDCANLNSFTVDAKQTTFYAQGGVIFTNAPEKTLVCFPPAYDAADYYYVPEDTVAVAPYAFAGLRSSKLFSIKMQEGVKRIGDYAFAEVRDWNLKVFVPDSLTEIGENLLQNQHRSIPFYGSRETAFAEYAQEKQIPYGIITDYRSEVQGQESVPPVAMEARDFVQTDENNIVEFFSDASAIRGDPNEVIRTYNLSELQSGHSGEVRLILESSWSEIAPDANGNTEKEFPPQTGLYGAGHTEGNAILRGYDRSGKLIAMQRVNGHFAFSFPGACNLGVEGGNHTQMTVIPVEPVYVASAGEYLVEPEKWHQLKDGNVFQYYIVEMLFPSFASNNQEPWLLYYGRRDAATGMPSGASETFGTNYQIFCVNTHDASSVEQLSGYALSFSGMENLMENEEFACMMVPEYEKTPEFAEELYSVLKCTKQTMVGQYYPTSYPVHKVIVLGDGTGVSHADWNGIVRLTDNVIMENDLLTFAHEVVHAVDSSIAAVELVPPSAWLEGRAEYLSRKVCDALDYHGYEDQYEEIFDWSFLSETDKADFFRYYYFSTNVYTQYSVGYYFFRYLNETYGEDVSAKIMANIAALTEYDSVQRSEKNALLFKQCVEAATEVGVFQNFVRDVVNK